MEVTLMKPVILAVLAALALVLPTLEATAATQLVWRTPAAGVTVGRGQRVTLATLDLSAYDRLRVVAVSRATTANIGTRLPATIRLYVGEGNALTLFDYLALNPDTSLAMGRDELGSGRLEIPANSWGATRLYNHPVIRTLAVVAVGEDFAVPANKERVTFDLFIYGEPAAP
jgi:hypothetical protein